MGKVTEKILDPINWLMQHNIQDSKFVSRLSYLIRSLHSSGVCALLLMGGAGRGGGDIQMARVNAKVNRDGKRKYELAKRGKGNF